MSDPNLAQPGALGGAFGVPATSLGGKLPPHPAATPQQLVPPPPVLPPPAPSPPPVTSAESAGDALLAVDDDTFPVGVYLLPMTITAAAKRRRVTGGDNARIVFDAIDALRDRLGELVIARQTGPGRADDSLFPTRRGESSQAAAARTGRRRLWSFQATATEMEVIDDLWDSTGARSRSELVSCALEEYLTPPRRRRAK
jgi:hypothetical protein